MRVSKVILPLSILILFLVGCKNELTMNPSTGNPTPKDYLKYEDADIFLLGGCHL
jgi:uncharacterized lipoprotein NlpE involved in copper resistance